MSNVDFHLAQQKAELATGPSQWISLYGSHRWITYQLYAHYHPFTDELIEKLNRDGLSAFLDVKYLANLVQPLEPAIYEFGPEVQDPKPQHVIDVSDNGPYAIYNWELFFHAPVIVATHLSNNQRFAEAQRWFHFVFDPLSTDTTVDAPARFWKFLRFRQETSPEFIEEVLRALAEGTDSALKTRMHDAILKWRNEPFQPHTIARGRYLAYQLGVVMKYLDNLLAWGDSLFRQDTMESLNEATQVYVLAANILGRKPQEVPARRKSAPRNYDQLRAAGIDAFGNALVALENEFPFNTAPTGGGGTSTTGADGAFGIGRSLYFCIPPNDKLLAYWDKVADRLFKLRHCMNIEGVVRQLALFDPPIDPGALVRAAAAGLDIASIVNNVNQPLSNVRGPLLLQKALELCQEVKSLGASLLSAIEKGESEKLANLRHHHELIATRMAREVKFLQWKEAEAGTESLLKSRATVFERFRHYKRILGADTADLDALRAVELTRAALTEETFDGAYDELVGRYTNGLGRENYRKETSVGGLMEFAGNLVTDAFGGKLGETLPLNKNEHAELNIFLPASDTFGTIAAVLNIAAPLLALIPQFAIHGTPFGVGGKVDFGGVQLSKGAKYAAQGAELISTTFRSSADRASKMASYYRRAEDYVLQANLAASELEQYGRQIVGALLREQVVKKEYDNQLKAIEHSEQIGEFLEAKFAGADLYGWMQGELSRIYFDCYKLAFDVAKRAEQTLQHELMRTEFDDLHLIKFGYWDSARKGLLAAETLYLDLKRLEMAYLEQHRREYELTKHVSLARLDPMALLKLKATGSCEVKVPEWLFDLDSPGQYMRRIKTVALSIPCITGPYTGVHCKLSLLRSTVRVQSIGDYERAPGEDSRFRDYSGAVQSIVTSSAQNDSGLFETNLNDERYLPFEGAGAESTWRLELPADNPQFDAESISDVVMHLRYTAREAGHQRVAAAAAARSQLQDQGLVQLFALDQDFGDAWFGFTSATSDATRTLALALTRDRFPYWVKPLGMDDELVATFAVIDWKKPKLTLAPATVPLTGTDQTGWTATIDQTSPVFAFLKAKQAGRIYLAVSYKAK